MGLGYEHVTPPAVRRELMLLLLGLILGSLVTATLMTTHDNADAIERAYSTSSHVYTFEAFEDGSEAIYRDGIRVYLADQPVYGK